MNDALAPKLPKNAFEINASRVLQAKADMAKPFSIWTYVYYIIGVLIVLVSWLAAKEVEFSLTKLRDGAPFMADFLGRMFPPDLTILDRVFTETMQTIALAWVATIFSIIVSFPIAFFAARNIFESKILRGTTIFLLNTDRAIDSLILALFFVSAVGLGPFAGTLALAIHSVGMLGKLFADAIEAIDPGPREALESAGAGKLAMIRWAVWPQVAPLFITYFLFRFELNVRVAVVLGIVGAGGIGFLLTQYMRLFQYQKVCTLVLVILVLVMVIDAVSSRLRRAVS
jgi:phosphonate transport system permease protein